MVCGGPTLFTRASPGCVLARTLHGVGASAVMNAKVALICLLQRAIGWPSRR